MKWKGTADDFINLAMISLCYHRILLFLTNIINACLLDNIFHDCWKDSKLYITIYTMSKVTEKIMQFQIEEHLGKYITIPECQLGYRGAFSYH